MVRTVEPDSDNAATLDGPTIEKRLRALLEQGESEGHCDDPECGLYPHYGVAPHECFYKRGSEFGIGQSIGLPPSQWPPNFLPDLEPGETAETIAYPNACGTYYCPSCHWGMPADGEGRVPSKEERSQPQKKTGN